MSIARVQTKDQDSVGKVSDDLLKPVWSLYSKPVKWWIAISAIAISGSPNGWTNLLNRAGQYYDAGNYTRIANSGYVSENLTAFYPLWPLIMRILSFGNQPTYIMEWLSSLLAALLFVVSAIIFAKWSERFGLLRYRNYVVALMILSPLSLFRVLPFTESLFSLVLMLLVWDLTAEEKESAVFKCGVWAFFLSSMRPMFPFLMISSVMIAAVLTLSPQDSFKIKKVYYKRLLAVLIAAPLGYVPYGIYCAKSFGNFWLPFTIQSKWERKLDLHWDLIFSPKVINGSNEVLVWDLIAFYSPLILFVWGLYFFWRYPHKVSLPLKIGFLFAVLIGCAHSAVNFLTLARFMSISRHVLANPLPYLALLIALQQIPVSARNDVRTARVLGFVVFASAVFLGMWWYRFAHDQWIG